MINILALTAVYLASLYIGQVYRYPPPAMGILCIQSTDEVIECFEECCTISLEVLVQCQASPLKICDVRSGTRIGLSANTSVFHCQYHSTIAALLIYLSPVLCNVRNYQRRHITHLKSPFHEKCFL